MDLVELIAAVRSGVVKLSVERNREIISNGTGFLVAGGLVTCSHNLPADSYDAVAIRFDNEGREDASDTIRWNASDVSRWVAARSDEAENDYVFLAHSETEFEHRHRFEFIESRVLKVGQQVVFLGFPFGSNYLTSHVGHISSVHKKAEVTVLQIDGSINKGNSGGPVLDPASGKVAGLITRNETGFIKEAFDGLLDSLDKNLRFIRAQTKSGTRVIIAGVDPVEAAAVTQAQLKELARQIRRSANVGIGFAFSTDALRDAVACP